MAHCIVSLKLARRFEENGQLKLEPICTKGNPNGNSNQDTATISQKSGKYLVEQRKQFEVIFVHANTLLSLLIPV